MLTIRTLSPADSIDSLTQLLHRAYARLGAMGLNYTAVDQSPEQTQKRIEGGQCYIAQWSGKLAGTILVKPTAVQSDCAYFTHHGVAAAHQFAVEPSLQGKGIGVALLNTAEHWAHTEGFTELALDTAEPAKHLIALYSALGFQHVGFVRWPGKVYRSVVLSKQLVERPTHRDRPANG